MVKAQALGKARCAVGVPDGSIVLGADTIVVLDNKVLGKPHDESDARHMLEHLSGRAHSVITGVALLIKGEEIVFHNETKVYFKQLAPFEIESYIASGEPMERPPLIAATEEPLPKWHVMIRRSVICLPINSAQRCATYLWDVPWKP